VNYKIVIIGTSGSGKTTLAKKLSLVLNSNHIELDSYYHGPNWEQVTADVFEQKVSKVINDSDSWIIEGNYQVVRELIWPKANLIIWLDYPFYIVFIRLFKRTIKRFVTKEVLWNDNTEDFFKQLFTKKSVLFWAIKTHWKNRKEFQTVLVDSNQYNNKSIRIKRPVEVKELLSLIKLVD